MLSYQFINTLLLVLHTVNLLTTVRINEKPLYDELELSILMTFFFGGGGGDQAFKCENRAFKWSTLVWKQKHIVQKPNCHWVNKAPVSLSRIPDVDLYYLP